MTHIHTKTPSIIYEDADLLILDKPSGMVVNRAESVKEATIQDWLDAYLGLNTHDKSVKNEASIFFSRSGIGHRLDKETSGVFVATKHPQSLENVMSQFKARQVQKHYKALVYGKLDVKKGSILRPITRSTVNRHQFVVDPLGKHALSDYDVEGYFIHKEQWYTLVSVYPHTGRTHQIRVHMRHIKHPLVSDSLYAGKGMLSKSMLFSQRLFLHSYSISLKHPIINSSMTFTSPLSSDLVYGLSLLEKVDV